MANLKLTLDEALKLTDDLIVTGEDGTKWVKLESLKELSAEVKPEPELPLRTFDQANALASQDPELREAFADRPPQLGQSPSAARA